MYNRLVNNVNFHGEKHVFMLGLLNGLRNPSNVNFTVMSEI